MSKRAADLERIREYKERFRSMSLDHLQRRLATGALYKEAAVAIRQLIEEKQKVADRGSKTLRA